MSLIKSHLRDLFVYSLLYNLVTSLIGDHCPCFIINTTYGDVFMAHILKLVRGGIKAVSVIISIALVLNMVSGLLGAFSLFSEDNISADVDPGDIVIDYSDLYIKIALNLENEGIYDMTGIVIGMQFEMKSNVTDWQTLLNTTSVELGSAPPGGQVIPAGNSSIISLEAELLDFEMNLADIASTFGLLSNWTLGDLIDINFDTILTLTFKIAYAFEQYSLSFTLTLEDSFIKTGLGL